jgi:hypothetical protein
MIGHAASLRLALAVASIDDELRRLPERPDGAIDALRSRLETMRADLVAALRLAAHRL